MLVGNPTHNLPTKLVGAQIFLTENHIRTAEHYMHRTLYTITLVRTMHNVPTKLVGNPDILKEESYQNGWTLHTQDLMYTEHHEHSMRIMSGRPNLCINRQPNPKNAETALDGRDSSPVQTKLLVDNENSGSPTLSSMAPMPPTWRDHHPTSMATTSAGTCSSCMMAWRNITNRMETNLLSRRRTSGIAGQGLDGDELLV